MPVTPLTTECRAVAGRMREFPNREGSCQYLRKLIYEDSASLTALITPLNAIAPPVDQAIVQGLYKAAATCGSVGECSGNTQMWPLLQTGADAVIAAAAAVEAVVLERDEKQSAAHRPG